MAKKPTLKVDIGKSKRVRLESSNFLGPYDNEFNGKARRTWGIPVNEMIGNDRWIDAMWFPSDKMRRTLDQIEGDLKGKEIDIYHKTKPEYYIYYPPGSKTPLPDPSDSPPPPVGTEDEEQPSRRETRRQNRPHGSTTSSAPPERDDSPPPEDQDRPASDAEKADLERRLEMQAQEVMKAFIASFDIIEAVKCVRPDLADKIRPEDRTSVFIELGYRSRDRANPRPAEFYWRSALKILDNYNKKPVAAKPPTQEESPREPRYEYDTDQRPGGSRPGDQDSLPI